MKQSGQKIEAVRSLVKDEKGDRIKIKTGESKLTIA